ncbi:interferon-induced protein 44-like [Haliotis cracherodii]|uniref:interferon-induced protein 44-like n=1 Tax=Haliotis cracherodii TaxID=6455 RepID=UPI0039ECBA7E
MARPFNQLCKEMLSEWLGERKRFKLLFESANELNVPHEFHRRCDKKGPTVSIFSSDKNLFGGYTAASWEAQPSPGSKSDRSAFVFKLYDQGSFDPRKYNTDDHSSSIYCHPRYGPTFGGGDSASARRDIETTCERRTVSRQDVMRIKTDLGQTYNSQRKHRKEDLITHNLIPTRFQVYQVLDDKEYMSSPWTTISHTNERIKEDIVACKWSPDPMKILLVSRRDAGQSSYIHSVRSAFRGYVTSTLCSKGATESRNSKRKEHQVTSGRDRTVLNFRLCESPGLEAPIHIARVKDSSGLIRTSFKQLYSFAQAVMDYYAKSSHLQRMQCIVFVIDCNDVDDLPRDIKREFDQWKEIANKHKIPQTVLLTKIDTVCSVVDQDLSQIFHSSKIADLVGKTAELMGLPRSHIFPVKNYVQEMELEKDVDRLTLFSLRQMLRFIQDRQCVQSPGLPEDIV